MESLLIPAIIYVLGMVFKVFVKEDDDDENKNVKNEGYLSKTINSTMKKVENNLGELSYKYKKQKQIENTEKEISRVSIQDIESKENIKNLSNYIDQEEDLNKEYDTDIKSTNSDEGFDLFSDSDDLMKAIIMSEILKKPKSMKR